MTDKAYMASNEVASQALGVEVGLSPPSPACRFPCEASSHLVQRDLTAVDYKSAAAKPDTGHATFDHELQLVTYQMMIEEATGDTPPSLDLIYLVKTKMPQVIRVKITQPTNSASNASPTCTGLPVKASLLNVSIPSPGCNAPGASTGRNVPGGAGSKGMEDACRFRSLPSGVAGFFLAVTSIFLPHQRRRKESVPEAGNDSF